jgi:hypothetical protein
MDVKECCPPGQGCNAPGGGECCALTLCQAAAGREDEAAVALERWQALQHACEEHGSGRERRFRRRAFQRARDRALMRLAIVSRRRRRRRSGPSGPSLPAAG